MILKQFNHNLSQVICNIYYICLNLFWIFGLIIYYSIFLVGVASLSNYFKKLIIYNEATILVLYNALNYLNINTRSFIQPMIDPIKLIAYPANNSPTPIVIGSRTFSTLP